MIRKITLPNVTLIAAHIRNVLKVPDTFSVLRNKTAPKAIAAPIAAVIQPGPVLCASMPK
jgi:hypothetical protein